MATTRGELLCKRFGLAFEDVFCQQFCLGQVEPSPLPGFQTSQLGHWYLQVGAGLPHIVTTIPEARAKVAVLGMAIDADGARVTAQSLQRQQTVADCIAYMNNCAGRYLLIVVSDGLARIYLDAIGSLGAVYDKENRRVAATVNLVLERDVIPNTAYPLTEAAYRGKMRFAYGHTPDLYVKRLLPNHFLSLDDFSTHRFWPTQDTISDVTGPLAIAYRDRIADRLSAIVDGLFAYTEDVRFALSGGLDSRTLLACVGPSLARMKLFTHAENMMSRKDTRIAKRLASYFDMPIQTIDPTRDPAYQINDPAFLMKLSNERHIALCENLLDEQISKTHLEIKNAQAPGGIILRGNGVDFLKAHHWGHAIGEYNANLPHSPQNGLKGMGLMARTDFDALEGDTYRQLEKEYVDWYSDFSGIAAQRPVDFMFIEHILAHSFGNLFYGFTRNFYICPFSDRNLLAMTISLSPERRGKLYFTEGIIAERSPKLKDMWYTRKRILPYLSALHKEKPKWYEDV